MNNDDDDDDDNEMWECIGVEFRLIDNRYVGLYIYECKYYYSDQWNFFRKWYCMKKKKKIIWVHNCISIKLIEIW